MELYEHEIWCDYHGTIHEDNNDPYGYEFELSGEKPKCGPDNWRKIWIGAYVEDDS